MHVLTAPDGSSYVAETAEIVRVRNLPWRDWTEYEQIDELRDRLTAWLQHTPAKCNPVCFSCRHVARLTAAQAVFLAEFYALGRSIVPFRTGAGKTLAALLAPTVLEKRIGRPVKALLIIPASGKKKTMVEAAAYARHWRCAAFQVVTYEFLANPKNAAWLTGKDFDIILADEAHRLSPGSKAWNRLGHYLLSRAKAGTPVVFLPFTASLTSRKLAECWHYCRVAMGDQGPFPASWSEAQVWAAATDEKVPEEVRLLPGALGTLAPFPPEQDLSPKRRAQLQFGARLSATPGVVSTREDVPSVTVLLASQCITLPDHVQAIVEELREKWTLPSGEQFVRAWDVWRHSRSLGCGLYYHWDPAPPPEWVVARGDWYRFAREYMRYHPRVDSKVLVANLVDRGEIDDGGVLERWREIRPTFEPVSVPEWIDTTVLEYAAEWLTTHEQGLCWVEYKPFGERLSAMTGLPYFTAKAQTRDGTPLVGYDRSAAIVSLKHREQFNLQHFNANLITSCPPVGAAVDQLIGRTVREGQLSNEVTVDFVLTTDETYACLSQCFSDAKRGQAVDGQLKKLLYGQCTDPLIEDLRANAA